MSEKNNAVDVAVGFRLRELREAAKISARDLARKVELAPLDIDQQERGEMRVTASHLWQFCEIFGLRPKAFYDGVELDEAAENVDSRDLQETQERSDL